MIILRFGNINYVFIANFCKLVVVVVCSTFNSSNKEINVFLTSGDTRICEAWPGIKLSFSNSNYFRTLEKIVIYEYKNNIFNLYIYVCVCVCVGVCMCVCVYI